MHMLNIPAKDFQKLTDSIEVLRLVNESQEYVVDLFSYKSPQSQKFSVYAMQHRLQKVPLPGILRVEKFQQLLNRYKLLVNLKFCRAEFTLTCKTNFWSITRLPMVAWKSWDSRNRKNTSYTSCRCGQEASRVGSSSSGSKSGFSLGGNVRNRLQEI